MNKVMMVVLASCMCVMNLSCQRYITTSFAHVVYYPIINSLFVLLSYGSPIAVQSNTIATEVLDIKEVAKDILPHRLRMLSITL